MRAYRVLIPALALLAACSDPAAKSNAQIPPLTQPTRAAPGDALTMKSSFAPVVKRAAPAVVNITSARTVERRAGRGPFFDDEFFRQFFGPGFAPGPAAPSFTERPTLAVSSPPIPA